MTASPTARPWLVPTARHQRSESDPLDLPRADGNLFSRIIRNPILPDRPPRERECTEMLCGVLVSAPTVRHGVMQWMASRAKLGDLSALDRTSLQLETEGFLAGKRDDLRFTASNDDGVALLWTVEVKVGAGFHVSSPIDNGGPGSIKAEPVHQLRNYDAWLDRQEAASKAGFVLSTSAAVLPVGLRCRWTAFTWTDLGRCVETLLARGDLPAGEAELARHLAGFIREHLWETTMTDLRLEFDDLALLRAHAVYGSDTEQRVNAFVARVVPLLESSGIPGSPIKVQERLFQGHRRVLAYRALTSDNPTGVPPWVDAGIVASGTPRMVVWLETTVNQLAKQAGAAAVRERLPALMARDPRWVAPAVGERSELDLRIEAPLETILAAPSQVEQVDAFFRSAFADLVETGVVAAYANAYKQASM
jgi:hypothetical protein